jgi:hypothetical protein
MNIRHACLAAFGLGLAALAWVGHGYLSTNPLALVMTLLIAAFYGLGGLELKRFHQATTALEQALHTVPAPLPNLADWLITLPAGLQSAVRLRIAGERSALPGPALTPFLLGLLVLLGMLGTFLGMVVTLNGAVLALDGTTDVATMRGALIAPVKGLGLAFGTSVAGVAASAVLGLISALCRRERAQVSQLLDTRIAGELRVHSRAHQRDETYKTLQAQSQMMQLVPAVVDQLQSLMAQLAQQHAQLGSQLQDGQARFHQGAEKAYGELAASVDRSLKHSLIESARLAAATLQPVAEATMAGIAREASALHSQVAGTVQSQLQTTTQNLAEHFNHTAQGLTERLGHTVQGLSDGWAGALARQAQQSEAMSQGLAAQTTALHERMVATTGQAHTALQTQLAAQDEQRLAAWRQAMAEMAATLQRQWQHSGEQALAQQQQICATLGSTASQITTQAEAHARATIAEIAQLMQSAAEAPRVAAEVIAQLRQQLSSSLANDNAMLEERSRIMATLGALLDAVQHASTEQRDVAAQISAGAVDVASLGETFGQSVQGFAAANDKLMAQLERIEAALGQSLARSDEQLAYYVAQAREVVDLSLLSQKQIIEELQRLSHDRAAEAA